MRVHAQTMFALADAVEQVEHELSAEQEKCAAFAAQSKKTEVRARCFRKQYLVM